jgi:hypothetical protein
MTREEIDKAIRRAQSARSMSVPKHEFEEIIGYATMDNASARLIANALNNADHEERKGEAYVTIDAGILVDLLTAAKRAMGSRAV